MVCLHVIIFYHLITVSYRELDVWVTGKAGNDRFVRGASLAVRCFLPGLMQVLRGHQRMRPWKARGAIILRFSYFPCKSIVILCHFTLGVNL